MPPYSLSPDIDSFIASDDPFGLGEASYEPTLTRASDSEQYGFGMPAAYRTNIGLLESQQEASESKAMELLKRAMQNSAEVTPTQGIAAALLAAIPTFGGYMIGKSVGRPDLPPGYFEAGGTRAALGDTSGIGAGPGGLAGAQAGLVAGGGYLKGLEANKAQENKVLQAQATIEANKAARLQGRADSFTQAGLAAQERKNQLLDPELRAAEVSQARQIADAQASARSRYDDSDNPVPREVAEFYGKETGFNPDMIRTEKDINRAIALKKEAGIGERQQKRFDREALKTNIYQLDKLPGVMPDERDQGQAQTLLKEYEKMNVVYLPELKRVFTDPAATLDEKEAALANMVITIKNQEEMGANFTAMERALVDAGLPKIAGISFGQLLGFMRAELQGQDALTKINRLEEITQKSAQIGLTTYGYSFRKSGPAGTLSDIDRRIAEIEQQLGGVE